MATIEARITKVEHDTGSGWFTIHTDHAQVKKLATRLEPKGREAGQLRNTGEILLIRYSHKQRHDESSGRTYDNYYYEGAATAPASTNGDSGSGIDEVQPQGERPWRKMDPSEAWRICLATGSKLAVETLPLMPTEQRTFEVQKQIALAWAQWIFTTPLEGATAYDGGLGSTVSGRSGPGAYDEPSYDAPPPHDDSDIPF